MGRGDKCDGESFDDIVRSFGMYRNYLDFAGNDNDPG